MSTKRMLAGGIVVVAIVLAVAYKRATREETPLPPSPARSTTETSSAVTVRPQIVVQKVGKQMKEYRFANFPNDCAVTDSLKSDASFYPKGKEAIVTIHSPTGESWEDTAGVPSSHNNTNQPPGQYMVCKKSSSAWGVEVWH